MLFSSFLLSAFLAAYLFKSLMRGLIPYSDRLAQRAMGLGSVPAGQVLSRRPRAAAAWNFAQAIAVGFLYSLVIAGVLRGYRHLGAQSFVYSAAAVMWALSAGIGFKTNPGSVFASCMLAVLLFLFFGFVGNLAAVLCFAPFLFVLLRSSSSEKKSANSVIIDVDAER